MMFNDLDRLEILDLGGNKIAQITTGLCISTSICMESLKTREFILNGLYEKLSHFLEINFLLVNCKDRHSRTWNINLNLTVDPN